MKKLLIPSIGFVVFMVLSLVFYASVTYKTKQYTKYIILQIEKQIALDLPLLDLSNKRLKHSGNESITLNYISTLNTFLKNKNIEVIAIKPKDEVIQPLKETQLIRSLNSNDGVIIIVCSINNSYFTASNLTFHLFFLMISLLMSLWVNHTFVMQSRNKLMKAREVSTLEPPSLQLIIDLNNKTLSTNFENGNKVGLANKPLCFFLALIEYCTSNTNASLNHNNNVPDELLEIANKYFYRLIELGHTIRKRPNFNTSLDKTLSEIRATLDEVLSGYPEQKQLYYPPKASGEGSRSRLHNYALKSISLGNIKIVGK